ncbi:MAG: exodeoxyribonuclease VII large subunit [Paludibacteraceae bacterium]
MTIDSISLKDLLLTIRKEMADAFSNAYWIRAEISEIRENANGHCYLELIEKDSSGKLIVAKSRASIWADTYRMLKPYFIKETGQELKSGMKVMVQVTVSFHELYGFNCAIRDIEPSFTIGDLARKRQEAIRQLQEDGIWDMNRTLDLPTPLTRIAIITSSTAAGYGDFIDQLKKNKQGYIFHTTFFPATMQGDGAADSIINALDKIYEQQEQYDAVAIIRGGGATTDLLAYDEYELAACCAQFPLPIITGIGHDRDQSVVDMVANTRCKTPTAVAAFLIEQMDETADNLLQIEESLKSLMDEFLKNAHSRLRNNALSLSQRIHLLLREEKQEMERTQGNIKHSISLLLMRQRQRIKESNVKIKNTIKSRISEEKHHLEISEKAILLLSPDYILKKGYSLTIKEGKIVKSQSELNKGDTITSIFVDGKKESIIK